MLILPERNAPYGDILLPMRRREWLGPSQRAATYGIENQTRYRLTARLADGFVAWRGWFDDREDADAFLSALSRHLTTGAPIPREIIRLTDPHEGWPEWSPLLTERLVAYEFHTLNFITANPGSIEEWRVPRDWVDPGQRLPGYAPYDELLFWSGTPSYETNTAATSDTSAADWSGANSIECVAGGGGATLAGSQYSGGGASYAKSVNLSGININSTVNLSVGVGGTSATSGFTDGGDSFFNASTFPSSGQACGAKGGRNGNSGANSGLGGAAASCYVTGPGSIAHSGGNAGNFAGGDGGPGGGGSAGPNAGGGNGFGANSTSGWGGGGADNGSSGNATGQTGGPGGHGGGNGGNGGNNGANGTAGGNGTEWDSSHGAGGGAGGGGFNANPGAAGLYGGGGSGAAGSATYSNGAQGLIVITYVPFTFAIPPHPMKRYYTRR